MLSIFLLTSRFLFVFYQTEFNVKFLTIGRRDVKFGYTKFADFFDNDRQTFDQLSATFRQFKNWPNWIVSTSDTTYYKCFYACSLNFMNSFFRKISTFMKFRYFCLTFACIIIKFSFLS